jgi:FkbM family methyltransferase
MGQTLKDTVRNNWAAARHWFWYSNSVAGKLVEWTGNRGRVGGLVFDLANPEIAPFIKGRFLLGTYEIGTLQQIDRFVPPELPVVELGACLGVASCLTNRRLRHPERHVVVEASPRLIPTLEANRQANRCGFQIINAAYWPHGEFVEFWPSPTHCVGGGLRKGGAREAIRVPAVTLRSILQQHGFERMTLLVDIEGTETALVDQELPLLVDHVEMLMMEVHPQNWGAGQAAIDTMLAKLKAAGFALLERYGNDVVYENKRLKAARRSESSPTQPSPEADSTLAQNAKPSA